MQEFKFNVTGTERKKLAGAISEILNTPLNYLGAPTFSYTIGNYIIDKNGTVTGEYDLNLIAGLAECGFEPGGEPPLADSPEPETADTSAQVERIHFSTPRGTFAIEKIYPTALQAKADDYGIYFTHENHDVYIKHNPDGLTEHSKLFALVGEPLPSPQEPKEETCDRLTVEVPNDFTPEQIDNLAKMVTAKELLLKKALGAENLPIRVTEDKIAFPWFTLEKPDDTSCYIQFIAALCSMAKEKKRVTAKAPDSGFENERFSMRVWLIGLGLVGKEYGAARKLLSKNLSGDSGWRYGKPEAAPAAEEAHAEEVQSDE